jgi:putative transposon-encoded protein
MKIIFVITRAAAESEYEDYWKKCLNDSNRKEVKNGNGKSMKIVISTKFIALHAFNGAYYNSNVDKLACEIKKTVDSSSDLVSLIIVLFHGLDRTKKALQGQLNKKLNGYEIVCKCYSSKDSIISYKKYIKPFGNCDKDVNELVKNLLNEVEGKNRITEAYSLFLPLDIDMQALEILAKKKENGVRVKVPKEYLEEMYADNIDYVQKLKELQAKVNTIGEIENINKERLKKLAGISNENVDQFFEKLGGKKNDSDEFLDHSWGIDGVNSFHDWYCALDSCLRGAEACEGK